MTEVRLNRLLKYINVLIGIVLVAGIALIFWFAVRPLPKTSGTIPVPITKTATATRDELGVPHIRAATVEDALFVQGYVTAQDRLWQMDIVRRAAAGELSEVIGRRTLELDAASRRLRIRRLAEEHARALPEQDRAYIAAYARGVNHFIETHRNNLPLEFTVLRYDPRPWTVADTLCVGLQMMRDLTSTVKHDIAKATMLTTGDPALVSQLYPVRAGQEAAPGSNAWAVSGKLTATGKPILANDPHLQYNFPSTWYMAHLQAPGMNVAGVSLPGLPGIIIGHNDRIAWGITNLGFDVQDLYLEQMNVNTGQYAFRGAVEQARPESELILVRGENAVEFKNWVTRHGPIWRTDGKQAMTLRWVAAEPGGFHFPFVQLNLARNWNDFRGALRRLHAPSSNLVYADVDGNIGYQAAGLLPIRRTFDGDVPVAGSTGSAEWDGFIPFEELPSAYNPASGTIVTSNQNPFPANYPYRVNGEFAAPYREHQIRALLSTKNRLGPEDMLTIQKDVYSSLSHFIARQAVAAFDKRGSKNESLKAAAEALRGWNGQMEKDQAAPMIAALIYQQLRIAIGNRASNGKADIWEGTMVGPIIERLLRDRPAEWFGDYDQLVLRCFVEALEAGRKLQGRNPERWRYGAYLETTMRHPIFGQADWVKYVPTLGKYFRVNVGPTPMSGSATTVKATTQRLGVSMRFVADLANWDNSRMNVTLGQSGQLFSWHYSDQWEAYYVGNSFALPFTKPDGSTLQFMPRR
jgi:penicillin G amidase